MRYSNCATDPIGNYARRPGGLSGGRHGRANDLVLGPDGRLWVTDTRGEIDFFNPDESMRGWVWAIDIASGAKELVLDSGPVFINALGFGPTVRG